MDVDLSGKLDKTGDAKDTTITFTDTTEDEELTSGSKVSTLISLIKYKLSNVFTSLSNKVNKGELIFNVKDYGAVGDGTHDDSPNIQAAIDDAKAHGGGKVYLPHGTYYVNSTIQVPSSVSLYGCSSVNGTIIKRTGDYGDTFIIGKSDEVQVFGVEMSDMWIWHINNYENGQPSSTFENPVNSNTAHVRLYGGVACIFRNIRTWNLPYNFIVYGGVRCVWEHCSVRGLYDHTESILQVTHSAFQFNYSASQVPAHPTEMTIINPEITGYLSPSRVVDFGGGHTVTQIQNIGCLNVYT